MAKRNKRLSNVEFVKTFMNYGSPMKQIFVMDAIGKLSGLILADKEKVRQDMKGHFIHPDAWIQCAEQWKKDYEQNYNE
ncbi:MAG: hypothetical protein V1775_00370 [Bacteroidota bacterium]